MKLSAKQLIGAWVLREWRIEYPQNMVRHPFGADAIGQLLYTHDGQMSATVSADKRPAQHHSLIVISTTPAVGQSRATLSSTASIFHSIRILSVASNAAERG
jgi:hypothetical protein